MWPKLWPLFGLKGTTRKVQVPVILWMVAKSKALSHRATKSKYEAETITFVVVFVQGSNHKPGLLAWCRISSIHSSSWTSGGYGEEESAYPLLTPSFILALPSIRTSTLSCTSVFLKAPKTKHTSSRDRFPEKRDLAIRSSRYSANKH